MDEFGLIEQFRPAPATSVAEVLARAAAMPDRAELEQAAAERAVAEARAEQRETQMMLNRAAGDPLGQLSRAESAAAELRDEVRDLESRLETVRGRLHRAAEAVVDFRSAADEVMTSSARRSDTADLLAPAKQALAEQRVERMLAAVQARPAGRPKEVSRGGEASRSHLECVYCLRENVDAETSALLHHDPTWDVPITTAAQAEQAEHAERRGHGGYAEVSR